MGDPEVEENIFEVLGVGPCHQGRDASHLQDAVGVFLEKVSRGAGKGVRLGGVWGTLDDLGYHPLEPCLLQLLVVDIEGYEGEAVRSQLLLVGDQCVHDAGGGDGRGDDNGVG